MINFTKMHGLGNDYLYINTLYGKNQIEKARIPELTRYMCHRNFGVGADGIILIKASKIADLKMEIYNKDGSQAQMCGNGIRCFGKYVYEAGILRKTTMKIETLAGIKTLNLKLEKGMVKEVEVNMGCAKWKDTILPNYPEKQPIEITINRTKIKGTAVSVGNPHFVILGKEIDKIDLETYGRYIEKHPIFPEKTNVEFIEIQGNKSIKMRVWERESGETFACGTGACAAFAVCYEKKLVRSQAKVYVKGGELAIRIEEKTKEIYLKGLTTKVFDGRI